jgi:hypothetical protein
MKHEHASFKEKCVSCGSAALLAFRNEESMLAALGNAMDEPRFYLLRCALSPS